MEQFCVFIEKIFKNLNRSSFFSKYSKIDWILHKSVEGGLFSKSVEWQQCTGGFYTLALTFRCMVEI